MRLIDADALIRKAVEKFYTTNYFLHISTMIDNAPTIDAEPVVRCKDCKWWDECDELDENGYCHHGEMDRDRELHEMVDEGIALIRL